MRGLRPPPGFIPAAAVPRQWRRADRDLCGVGLLVEAPPNGYQVHDYTNYNHSREHVEAKRTEAKQRLRQWREKRTRNAVTDTFQLEGGNANETLPPTQSRPDDWTRPVYPSRPTSS